jgi:hypothetical protein
LTGHSKFVIAFAATVAAAATALTACVSTSALAASPTAPAIATASLGKCVAADISGAISFKDIAGSTAEATVTVRNKSGKGCTVHGYPGFGFLNSADQLMTDSKTVRVTGVPVTTFTVQPGGYASTTVQWKLCGSGGAMGSGGELQAGLVLTMPGDTRHSTLKDENSGKDTRQYVWRTCSETVTGVRPFRPGQG